MTATKLKSLKAAADEAGAAFDVACRAHYHNARWGAYQAEARGEPLPPEVLAACEAHIDAAHAFYLARDGERGFLGGRGL